MNNEQKLPLAEIKAGLKLAKEAYDVLASDTDYVKGIRYHLERVDAALQSGNLEMILYCNQQVIRYLSMRFFDIIRSNSLYSINFSSFYLVVSPKGITFASLNPGSP